LRRKKKIFQAIAFEINADDESLTLNYFKNGTASACVSSSNKEILGRNVSFFGYVDYALAASPAFMEKYFIFNAPKKNLKAAPVLGFDQKDDIQEKYLHKYFGITAAEL